MNKTGSHLRGDQAELFVAMEAFRRGHKVSFPYGQDTSYDLIVDREGSLERVQVKCVASDGEVVKIPCRSITTENGKTKRVNYTPENIDWLVAYDEFDSSCYFIPSDVLGPNGKDYISLRIVPPKNKQQKGINWAKDFKEW